MDAGVQRASAYSSLGRQAASHWNDLGILTWLAVRNRGSPRPFMAVDVCKSILFRPRIMASGLRVCRRQGRRYFGHAPSSLRKADPVTTRGCVISSRKPKNPFGRCYAGGWMGQVGISPKGACAGEEPQIDAGYSDLS